MEPTDNPGDSMDTLTDATQRLQAQGYTANVYAADDGTLRCDEWPEAVDPGSLQVDHVLRFEGQSDPGDSVILYAFQTPEGHRGIYTPSFGPQMPPEDVEIIALLDHRTSPGSLDEGEGVP